MAKATDSAERLLARYHSDGRVKTAAFPFAKEGPPAADGGGAPPEGIPGGDAGSRRNIPQNHPFDPRALKPMAKALWATSVGLGHALTAYRHLSRLKSTTVSPDGLLGGRGYVMGVKDARQKLFEACESLSTIADTLFDEIQGPHWKPKLAMLDENDAQDVARFVEESQGILADPEADANEEIKDIEQENDGPGASDEDDEESASEMPGGGPGEESEAKPVAPKMKESKAKTASSGLPGGGPAPAVELRGPGTGEGPHGSWNPFEDATDDDWGLEVGWGDDLGEVSAQSMMPSDPMTPTDAFDWGFGDADGRGIEERGAPGGPASDLPAMAAGPEVVDVFAEQRQVLMQSLLPNDSTDPVARSDYYPGPKGHQDHHAGCGCDSQATSDLPGAAPAPIETSLMGDHHVVEDAAVPTAHFDNFPEYPWPQEGLTDG